MKTLEINKMSVDERLQCIEDIWDSLIHDDNELSSPGWHKEVLEERQKKVKSGTAKFYTIDQVKDMFRK